ncbi:hypothetical protein [Serratia ficaria]|uniref:hypothetical protein n=1 Tax=Serratia ficaria TaxID=61651 RepID=UPI0021B7A0FC|nr:hypothetical protein [Serratia ficaria]
MKKKSANACAPLPSPAARRCRRATLPPRREYVRFAGVAGIISSSYDVFANAQRIVKVKEAKSEERTVMKSQHPIFSYESLAGKPCRHGLKTASARFSTAPALRAAIRLP